MGRQLQVFDKVKTGLTPTADGGRKGWGQRLWEPTQGGGCGPGQGSRDEGQEGSNSIH